MVTATTNPSAPGDLDDAVDIDAEDGFIERTSTSVLVGLTGLACVGLGFLLDYLGFDIWAGVTGAFAIVLLGIAVLGQAFVWASAYL